MLASVAALLLSANGGFLGFHDSLNAPWAATSMAVELAGAFVLALGASLELPESS